MEAEEALFSIALANSLNSEFNGTTRVDPGLISFNFTVQKDASRRRLFSEGQFFFLTIIRASSEAIRAEILSLVETTGFDTAVLREMRASGGKLSTASVALTKSELPTRDQPSEKTNATSSINGWIIFLIIFILLIIILSLFYVWVKSNKEESTHDFESDSEVKAGSKAAPANLELTADTGGEKLESPPARRNSTPTPFSDTREDEKDNIKVLDV